MKMLLLGLLLSFHAAAECDQRILPGTALVTWKAYKTPKKVGVDGKFEKVKVNMASGETTFDIDVTSVSTGNPERDKKISKNFFESNGKPMAIKGKVTQQKGDNAVVLMTMGASTKEVTFTKVQSENKVRFEAVINVLEFGLKSNLDKLTLACKALHEGITWPDVAVAIEFQTEKKCD